MLVDRMGRVAKKVRISLTDRCNFACLFCMPNKKEVKWLPRQEILSFEEITRLTRILATLGVEKVRLTGGEPLLRRGVEELVSKLKNIQGIKEVDMTTNGWYLSDMAQVLKKAGLDGVTVSLHSLKRERFSEISGIDALDRVLLGIEKAREVGLRPLKINTVAIRGYNEDEIIELVNFARERGISIRFIEFMPLDGLGTWSTKKLLSGAEILNVISSYYRMQPVGREKGATASLWKFEDGKGEVGLITPMTEPFCDDCDRIRLTADGKILTCLFDTNYYDVKSLLRQKASDEDIAKYVREVVYRKPAGVAYMPWVKKSWEKPRAMHAIGG
ncbi:MAG: GTP 3',8-cyclase MoaA [Conexivisphaerales archaeon]